jgi:hypothetical protein
MNKNVIVALIALFGAFTLQAYPCEIIFEKVGSGGNRTWNDSPSLMCLASGSSCKRTVIECDVYVSSVSPVSGGGYTLSGKITQISHQSVGISPPGSFNTNGSSISFLSNEYNIRIDNCSQFPFLNGVTISANSVTTNSSGEFTVFVPVYQ